MRLKTFLLAAHFFVFGLVAPASAQFITFGTGTKVVFQQEVIDGFTVTRATATVTETAVDGTITVRRQSQVIVPDGSGGFEMRETQETTIATPDPTDPGVFSVETTTDLLKTPLDGSQNATGSTVTAQTVVTDPSVNEGDLNLPPSTTFVPLDEDLDEPIVISPA